MNTSLPADLDPRQTGEALTGLAGQAVIANAVLNTNDTLSRAVDSLKGWWSSPNTLSSRIELEHSLRDLIPNFSEGRWKQAFARLGLGGAVAAAAALNAACGPTTTQPIVHQEGTGADTGAVAGGGGGAVTPEQEGHSYPKMDRSGLLEADPTSWSVAPAYEVTRLTDLEAMFLALSEKDLSLQNKGLLENNSRYRFEAGVVSPEFLRALGVEGDRVEIMTASGYNMVLCSSSSCLPSNYPADDFQMDSAVVQLGALANGGAMEYAQGFRFRTSAFSGNKSTVLTVPEFPLEGEVSSGRISVSLDGGLNENGWKSLVFTSRVLPAEAPVRSDYGELAIGVVFYKIEDGKVIIGLPVVGHGFLREGSVRYRPIAEREEKRKEKPYQPPITSTRGQFGRNPTRG